MTNSIKLLVRIILSLILISGLLLVKRAFAETEAQQLSKEYNDVFREFLLRKIQTQIRRGMHVTLYLKDRTEVSGTYERYMKYDDSIWITEDGHFFATAYGLNDLQDIVVSVKRNI